MRYAGSSDISSEILPRRCRVTGIVQFISKVRYVMRVTEARKEKLYTRIRFHFKLIIQSVA